jgi:CubicO group peptidase (beta-lactamase class C family)
MMRGFPPRADLQVTLANWRTYPATTWSYSHVRQLLPTAPFAAAAQASPLPASSRALGPVDVTHDGAHLTLDDVLRRTSTDALVVMRHGALLQEWYGNGSGPQQPHIVFSVSKSICGALAGILAERGVIDPDAPVIDTLPEVAGSAYATCTIRHLLDMTVGISFVEDYEDPDGDVIQYRRAVGWDPAVPGAPPSDLRSYLVGRRPDGRAHGDVFHYVSTNTDLMGWLFERASGRPLADLISELIWQPMGAATEGYITVDAHGAMRAAGGICVSPHDLARFGEMIRRRGVAGDRQVVPGWWIDDITRNGDAEAWRRGDFAALFPDGRYRSKWYAIDPARGVLAALGIHGQWIYIDPPSGTVIVRLGSDHTPLDPAAVALWTRTFAAIAAT